MYGNQSGTGIHLRVVAIVMGRYGRFRCAAKTPQHDSRHEQIRIGYVDVYGGELLQLDSLACACPTDHRFYFSFLLAP